MIWTIVTMASIGISSRTHDDIDYLFRGKIRVTKPVLLWSDPAFGPPTGLGDFSDSPVLLAVFAGSVIL
jgi:hypothetical protein